MLHDHQTVLQTEPCNRRFLIGQGENGSGKICHKMPHTHPFRVEQNRILQYCNTAAKLSWYLPLHRHQPKTVRSAIFDRAVSPDQITPDRIYTRLAQIFLKRSEDQLGFSYLAKTKLRWWRFFVKLKYL